MPFFLAQDWMNSYRYESRRLRCFFFLCGGGWSLSVYTLEKLAWNPKNKVWKMMFLFISGWFSGSILFLLEYLHILFFRIWLQICRICLSIIFFGLPLLNLACFCWCVFVRDHSTAYIFGGKQIMQMYGKIWRISSNKLDTALLGLVKKRRLLVVCMGLFLQNITWVARSWEIPGMEKNSGNKTYITIDGMKCAKLQMIL